MRFSNCLACENSACRSLECGPAWLLKIFPLQFSRAMISLLHSHAFFHDRCIKYNDPPKSNADSGVTQRRVQKMRPPIHNTSEHSAWRSSQPSCDRGRRFASTASIESNRVITFCITKMCLKHVHLDVAKCPFGSEHAYTHSSVVGVELLPSSDW